VSSRMSMRGIQQRRNATVVEYSTEYPAQNADSFLRTHSALSQRNSVQMV
jgi:hypothetical protein